MILASRFKLYELANEPGGAAVRGSLEPILVTFVELLASMSTSS